MMTMTISISITIIIPLCSFRFQFRDDEGSGVRIYKVAVGKNRTGSVMTAVKDNRIMKKGRKRKEEGDTKGA